MHAYRLVQWQHPPELVEVRDPEPGPGEVVVRVGGAGVCHSDLHLIHDFPAGALPFDPPFTLGHENAGWVDAVGVGVTGLDIDQPVAVYGCWGCGRCGRCRQGMENYCDRQAEIATLGGGLGRDGGMAPKLLVPDARLLIPLDRLEPADAAPLTDAALTPYHAIKRSLERMGPGTSTVVIGVGGLGHLAVELLKVMTATEIVAVDARPEALVTSGELGADHAVTAGPDAADAVADATKGRGADVVLDFVGTDDTLALAVGVSRSLSHVTLVGIGGGSHQFGFFTSPYEVSFATTYWGSSVELMDVIALAEAGRIHPRTHRFGFDRVADAYHALEAGTVDGRAVVVPVVP
jgi:alcohol dehydrogenase, propanol-preferring